MLGRRSTGLRSFARAVALVLAFSTLAAEAQIVLPDFGDSSESVLSSAQDESLGDIFMRAIRARAKLVDDPEVVDYIQGLGSRLAAASDRNSGFHFFVLEERSINAFAAPGGNVGVNAGLITATRSESELASALAHEIAHVTQRHIARGLELAGRSNVRAVAGLIAAILIGTQNPQAGQAAAAAISAGETQRAINFTRANEQEADRVGMQILLRAKFDPRDMAGLFQRLQLSYQYYSRPPEYLSTHPVTTSRIADSRNRAAQLQPSPHTDSLSYQLVRAKLEVWQADSADKALELFQQRLQSGADGPGSRYGLALSLIGTGQRDRARTELLQLREKYPDSVSFRATLAEVSFDGGDTQEAIRLYREGLGLFPENRVLTRGYAQALLKGGRPQDTIALLETYGRNEQLDSSLYKISAEANEQVGRRIDSKLALAEHYYLEGDLDAAIGQLRQAMAAPGDGDFYQRSRVEARLGQFEGERDERGRK